MPIRRGALWRARMLAVSAAIEMFVRFGPSVLSRKTSWSLSLKCVQPRQRIVAAALDTTRQSLRCSVCFVADSYLVDPASSHMLVSKIKPCMSKYKLLHSETANGSLDRLWFLRSYNPTWITVAILELIHDSQLRPRGKSAFIRSKPIAGSLASPLVTLDKFVLIAWPSCWRRIFQMSALSNVDGT